MSDETAGGHDDPLYELWTSSPAVTTSEAPQLNNSKEYDTSGDVSLDPLWTLKGDIARLLKTQKLSEKDIKSIDKNLIREVEEYGKSGGDKKFIDILESYQKPPQKTTPQEIHKESSLETQVDDFIQKTTADIIAEQIPKARREAEALREKLAGGEKESLSKIQAPQKDIPVGEQLQKTPTKPALPQLPPEGALLKLEQEKLEIERKLAALPSQQESLEKALGLLLEQKSRLEKFLAPLIEKESEFEQKSSAIELEEQKQMDAKERRSLEEKRWVVEDERRNTEEKRWKTDQEIIRIQKELQTIQSRVDEFAITKAKLEDDIRKIERKKEAITAERNKKILLDKLSEIAKMKDPMELEWVKLNEKRGKNVQKLNEILTSERDIERQVAEIEIKEKDAATAENRHGFESDRWKIETSRRDIEKQRWGLEDDIGKIDETTALLKEKYQQVLTAEKKLSDKVTELEELIEESSLDSAGNI